MKKGLGDHIEDAIKFVFPKVKQCESCKKRKQMANNINANIWKRKK